MTMAILLCWQIFVMPRLAPKPQPVAKAPVKQKAKPAKVDPAKPEAPAGAEKPAKKVAFAPKPSMAKLGSLDPKTGYRMLVQITSRGASVTEVFLSDLRYPSETDRKKPLRLIGNDIPLLGGPDMNPRTFQVTLEGDDIAEDAGFKSKHWEQVPGSLSESGVTYRFVADGVEVLKRFELTKSDPAKPDTEKSAYQLGLVLTIKNLGDKEETLRYQLQGPVGLPLENAENTSKYRDVIAKFVQQNKSEAAQFMAAKTIVNPQTREVWLKPMRYIGVDAQYFAALLSPGEDQLVDRTIESATQDLIGPDRAEKSDVSVILTSKELELAKGASVVHHYNLFAGPKRPEFVDGDVLNYGWFSVISRMLLRVLHAVHAMTGSYAMAIFCLTVLVRTCVLPLSIKQARSAAKMQELQPEIAALKEKYGNDKEKMARAQMELFSRHKYNPFAGCLPVFFQIPVFIGLYQALSHAVELRMAQFLWIDNLAAPDHLFTLPFAIPFLGNQFNLLPLITVCLFVVQQKMFMPPPMNEEQEMQYKMMNFMTIFMGFMFYKVPAGLCLYFITSSLWGLAERKLLPKAKPAPVVIVPAKDERRNDGKSDGGNKGRNPPPRNDPPAGDGFLARLLKAAEKPDSMRNTPIKRK